jgi:sec-independent protein translocase protein TatB
VKQVASHVQHELSQELQSQELKDKHQQAEQMKANDPFPELHPSHESMDPPIRDGEQSSTHDESTEKPSK